MFNALGLKKMKVTVMGLGLHGGGVGVVNWLIRQGATVLVTDLREKKILLPSLGKIKSKKVTFVLGRHRLQDFSRADLIIKNPGVPRDSAYLALARKKGIPIETDISLFFRLCPAPIIGVTGTKGKSTTTMLIYEFLRRAGRKPVMGGNIRISPLQFLGKIKESTPVVLELSSWQLEDMDHLHRSPHIAVVTNILSDHLNRYRGLADYTQAKKIVYRYQQPDDVAVLNRDNPITRSMGAEVAGHRFWFSRHPFQEENGCFTENNRIIFRYNGVEEAVGSLADIRLPGDHNVEHVLAAVIVARLNGVTASQIKKALRDFRGLADRLELIRTWRGRMFYNDTTATAPEATMAALRCFRKKIILLAGGSDKRLSYRELARRIKQKVAFSVLFRGTATDKLLRELRAVRYMNFLVVPTMPAAVQVALEHSTAQSVVLLSPGAASFGMFLNEFDRGDQFKKAVTSLE